MEEAREKRRFAFVEKAIQFLREVKQEMDRVTWPTKEEVKGATVVVIIVVILIGFFIGLVDKILTMFNDLVLF